MLGTPVRFGTYLSISGSRGGGQPLRRAVDGLSHWMNASRGAATPHALLASSVPFELQFPLSCRASLISNQQECRSSRAWIGVQPRTQGFWMAVKLQQYLTY